MPPSSVLQSLTRTPISALYTSNPIAPLGSQAGLRQYYEFGVYSYCGFISAGSANTSPSWVNSSHTPNPSIGPGAGICTGTRFNRPFTPYDYMTSDMVSNYTQLTITYVPGTAFRNSGYLNRISKVARWTLLFGTISCVISVVMYVCPDFILFYFIFFMNLRNNRSLFTHTLTFILAALCSILSTICLLIASSNFTTLVNKCKEMNSVLANSDQRIPVGIVVGGGNVIPLMWASVVCMTMATIPFLIS